MAGSRLLFASNGALYASLLPWYPTLSDELSLSSSRFGLIVACYVVGSICSSALPPRPIARWGPVPVVGTVVLAVVIAAGAWSPSGAFLATSPVVGVLADGVGLRRGLGILIMSGGLVVAVCGHLGQHGGCRRT